MNPADVAVGTVGQASRLPFSATGTVAPHSDRGRLPDGYALTWITFAGGKPLKWVLEAAEYAPMFSL